MKRLSLLLCAVGCYAALVASEANAAATVFTTPVSGTLDCGTDTVTVAGSFRVVAAQSTGSTVFHVTADNITGVGTSGIKYRLVGAGADITAGVGATTVTSFHHGTLVGAGGQPIHPLMYTFHATLTPSGQTSMVNIDVSDCTAS